MNARVVELKKDIQLPFRLIEIPHKLLQQYLYVVNLKARYLKPVILTGLAVLVLNTKCNTYTGKSDWK